MTEYMKVGFYAKIGDIFYQITAVEPLNYATGEGDVTEFTVIATAATSGFKDITEMEPAESPPRLYQVRAGVQNGLVYRFKLPSGTNRWGVDEDKDIGYIDNIKSPYFDKNEDYEFWLINDYYPSIEASNAVGISIIPKVHFEGMKYDIRLVDSTTKERLLKGQLKFREITLGGVRVSE